MQYGQTVVQVKERWLWNDEEFCKDPQHQYPLSCYFNIRHECPNSTVEGEIGHRNKFGTCTKYIWDMDSRQAFRLAGTEYLFSNLSTALIAETEKAIVDVFGQDGIPENLISVHMRWGDKRKEMQLVEENEYIAAIENFVSNHTLTEPHVYITTESAEALEKMRQALAQQHPTWKVHYYHQNSRGVVPTGMADQTKGAIGKDSLVSLLLAMEAKYYVITSGSNWSRLIDELRRSVVDVDCGGCTEMVDLRQAWLGNQNWRRHRYRV